jgi:hypothetical protein
LNDGRFQEAAREFYEAAVRLAKAGSVERALAWESAIRRADSPLADRLRWQLKRPRAGA